MTIIIVHGEPEEIINPSGVIPIAVLQYESIVIGIQLICI